MFVVHHKSSHRNRGVSPSNVEGNVEQHLCNLFNVLAECHRDLDSHVPVVVRWCAILLEIKLLMCINRTNG